MQVREAMAKTISTAHTTSSVREVAEIMQREDCGFVPVMADGELVGVVTDRDIVLRFCAAGAPSPSVDAMPIGEIMTPGGICVQADASLEDAGHLMAEHAVRRLPVLEDDKLVGILSFGNLEQAVHAHGECAEEVMLGVTVGA